jgi:hypothetical protein
VPARLEPAGLADAPRPAPLLEENDMPVETLSALLTQLRTAKVVPRPAGEDWAAMIERIHVSGRVCEIDEETYDWFLECLPPKWMGSGFAFAEGAEPLKLFWKQKGRFFVRQLTWDETRTFCRLAKIPIPS